MTSRTMLFGLAPRIALSASLAVGGYVHADLYTHGYRWIPGIGPSFLIQSAASFALAAVVLAGPWTLRVAAAGLALGTLAAFVASRTTGVFGFTETGWNPAPQAALSVTAEVVTLLLCAVGLLRHLRHRASSDRAASV
ncbi:hypothetical protein BJY24_000061 [Nocardia transvalensis]|uniref:Uncharacterized protein n=1 Tax=Nocardia transvalensis TaxID=37333 RepID=A0A7W9UFH0_9NOCA|nr:hypothetical protein [Nocardia transvalensis]MBB5911194.1 hypothetical protein [Nocardia transvalensis]